MNLIPLKKSLFIGIILLGLGLLIIGLVAYLQPKDTFKLFSFDVATTQSYYSDKFNGETGDLLHLEINTNGSSVVHVTGQVVGEIFKVQGTAYSYEVRINQEDIYQVQVENKAGHYEFFFFWTPDDNHIVGNVFDSRTAAYVTPLNITSIIVVVIGLVVSAISLFQYLQEKHKVERSRKCPQCGQIVKKDNPICPYCGFDVTKSIRCKHCNAIYSSSLFICPVCGAKRG